MCSKILKLLLMARQILTTNLTNMLPPPSDSGSVPSPQPAAPPDSPNRALLDEINAAGTWVHVRKTKAIRARRLDKDETVSTLEGPIEAKAGAMLCQGGAGELWPQSAESLEKRYIATDDVTADGWCLYAPRPDAEGALAAPVLHAFTGVATWGPLQGKAGDYVLKRFSDRKVPWPEDVWVVDRALFCATYESAAS